MTVGGRGESSCSLLLKTSSPIVFNADDRPLRATRADRTDSTAAAVLDSSDGQLLVAECECKKSKSASVFSVVTDARLKDNSLRSADRLVRISCWCLHRVYSASVKRKKSSSSYRTESVQIKCAVGAGTSLRWSFAGKHKNSS